MTQTNVCFIQGGKKRDQACDYKSAIQSIWHLSSFAWAFHSDCCRHCPAVNQPLTPPPPRVLQLLDALVGVPTWLHTFPAADLARLPPAPLCWMWGQLALAALQRMGACWAVLLGDDISMQPPGAWVQQVVQRFRLQPALRWLHSVLLCW